MQEYVCWAVANIAAGTAAHVQTVIDAHLYNKVLHIATVRSSPEILTEISLAVFNAVIDANPEQISALERQGLISVLIKLLAHTNAEINTETLQSINALLKIVRNNSENEYQRMKANFYSEGIENALIKLDKHECENVLKHVRIVRRNHFP